jgi:hypothetical protein
LLFGAESKLPRRSLGEGGQAIFVFEAETKI